MNTDLMGTDHAVSEYERMFGVEGNRSPGRPPGSGQDRFVFRTTGKRADLAKKAKQRATAVVMEENRDRLRDLYENEYKAMVERQG